MRCASSEVTIVGEGDGRGRERGPRQSRGPEHGRLYGRPWRKQGPQSKQSRDDEPLERSVERDEADPEPGRYPRTVPSRVVGRNEATGDDRTGVGL